MRRGWWRYALQQRLGTLAAAGLILWTAATAVAAAMATGRIAAAIRDERQTRAFEIAARIEQTLRDDLRQLDLIAAASARAADDRVLAMEVRRLRLAESVLRLDRTGQVLWARAVSDGRTTAPFVTALPQYAAHRFHLEGTNIVATAAGERAFLVLPARESDAVGGAVAAAIAPGASALHAVLGAYAREPYRVELVDEAGSEIAASRPAPPGAPPSRGIEDDDRWLVAVRPISNGQWRLRLAQPRDEALAAVFALRRVLVGSSLLLLPFAVLVAVATARSIRQPVLAMTDTAERLARGDFGEAIPTAGEDEIGRLAHALEQLRRTLQRDDRRTQLLKRVISAQEEERRRIARELHDQTTQQLTAVAMQLDSAATAPSEAAIARARTIARAAIDDLHRVIHDLRPSMLDDLGLLPAVASYARTHLEARGIEVHCEFPDVLPDIPPEAATSLYRVAQEALTNIERHSGADTVLIGCTANDSAIVLEVEDDGVGFDPASITRPRETGEGLGLLGMRERLALFGGSLDIDSEPDRGTRVVAVLPLTPPRGEVTP